ncbi:Myb-like DNA-binding domain containing protein [Trichomonas vaginalis G3]|uniref:Myb-like DNA-binding domain containing protein n=1 Tax=Trichomonas vaginalis (strain ATCC PRA-98 / G3) TaxID=412133 RepID=A2FD22_TRIV3|nr:RNA polymerase II transcription regulator recruiting protein [Trichomonas vaginalis G3]EAX97215.1 Myb-like DNA-binding domain containing protein [Trichomonas vaginalis G3]KAI5536204.1 RNA polymerase II transcription regulator recruiting protein [Trichomonas vaginalis G3]|eukprot:XP_001310145.1 Myb-like DNA-binding domain containing protein [Trichomonas vaginalis G3]
MSNSFLGQHCILEYFSSQFQDLNPEIDDSVFENLKEILLSYIRDSISYEDCLSIFMDKLGTTTPLEMLKAVLETDVNAREEIDSSSSDSSSDSIGSVSNSGRKRARPWNTEEDRRLLAGILHNGTDNWSLVAEIVGETRTRAQCSQRWFRGLDPRISKKRWSAEEDKKLLDFVEEYGETAWAKIANSMGNRSDVQCRYHYQQLKKMMRKPSNHMRSQHNSSKYRSREEKPISAVKVSPLTSHEIPVQSHVPMVEGVIKRALPPMKPFTMLLPLEPPNYLNEKMLATAYSLDAFLHHFGL